MDQYVTVLDVIRSITALVLLGYGAYSDIRIRKVRNQVWQIMGSVALLTLLMQMYFEAAPWYYYLLLPGMLVLFLYAYVGLPETEKLKKGVWEDSIWTAVYLVGILSTGVGVALVYMGPGMTMLFWTYMGIDLLMLVFYLMYYLPIGGIHLLHGGADAKCMLALAMLFPLYPHIGPFPLLHRMSCSISILPMIGILFPFSVSVLMNAALATVFIFILFPLINLIRGDTGGLRMFLGYRMELGRTEKAFVWLMERVDEEGKAYTVLFPGKGHDECRDRELLGKMGVERVWVTPKIPFIVPLFVSVIVTFLFGNILFELVGTLMTLSGG